MSGRKFPLAILVVLYVVAPVSCFGGLVGAMVVVRAREQAAEEERAARIRAETESRVKGLQGLFAQALQQSAQVSLLRDTLASLPVDDPRRGPLQTELDDARLALARTEAAIRASAAPGMPMPAPGACGCAPTDPLCECIH